MASSGVQSTKTVVVDIKLLNSDIVKNIQELQGKIANLKTAMDGMKKAGMENSDTYVKYSGVLKEMQQTLKSNQKVLVAEIQQQKSNGDSINALRGRLKSLRAEYEDLNKVERESAKGRDMLDHISDLTKELKVAEEAQFDFSRNIGNYKSALDGLPFGKVVAGFNQLSQGTGKLSVALKNGAQMVGMMGKQFLALLANPIVAGIAAIVLVVMKLTDAFKKNDEAMTALKSLMASFAPVIDLVDKAFQMLTVALTKAINGISSFVQKVMSFIPALRDYSQANEDIVRSTDALEEAERQYAVNHAERENEISELREKAVDAEKYTFKERKKFLEEAQKLEENDIKEKKSVAEERYRIAEEEAKKEIKVTELTEEAWERLSDEQKNRLTTLKTEMLNTQTELNTFNRRVKKEMNSLSKQDEADRKQRVKAAAEAAKERAKTELTEARTLEDMYINGITDMYERQYTLTKNAGERQIVDLKRRLDEEKNLTVKARELINTQIILAEADLQTKLGDMRDQWMRNAQTKSTEQFRNLIEWQLKTLNPENYKSLTGQALVLSLKLQLNALDRNAVIGQLEQVKKDELEILKQYADDLKKFETGQISEDEILAKYNGAFHLREIALGNTLDNMRQLVKEHGNEIEFEVSRIDETLGYVKKFYDQEEERIRNDRLKGEHDFYNARTELARKHAEILRQIELESTYDSYGRNELEKTRIMKEQAEARLQVAKDEYSKLAEEREIYTDGELKAIYGSVGEYDNILAESSLKVVQAENDVKDAVKAVSDASINQKSVMIQTATSVMDSMESVVGSIQNLFQTMADDDEKFSDYATGMALMQILVSTAISIANAIEGATAAGAATGIASPFTTPVFIAEMIAIVTGAITNATATLLKAKQQKKSSPKFAEGGLVGNFTTRRTDDSVDARLSLGEYVIPTDVVSDLGVGFFDNLIGRKGAKMRKYANTGISGFATGGFVTSQYIPATEIVNVNYEAIRDVMADAVGDIRPVVSVREITSAQRKVEIAENISIK